MRFKFSACICVFFLINKSTLTKSGSCTTPDGQTGQCSLLNDCPQFQKLNDTTKRSICKIQNGQKYFCCPNLTTNNRTTSWRDQFFDDKILAKRQLPDWFKMVPVPEKVLLAKLIEEKQKFLPLVQCGEQHSDERFDNATGTALDEFPWMAQLIFTNRSEEMEVTLCLGALITNRFVLTSSDCIIYLYENDIKIKSVKLGEHNTDSSLDCHYEEDFGDCSDIDYIEVETVFMTENFEKQDLALLKLKYNATFSDYIRPICLPLPSNNHTINTGDPLVTSGWGTIKWIEDRRKQVNIKKKSVGVLASAGDCKSALEHDFNYDEKTHLCFREGPNGTCIYDGGGPLMFRNGNSKWFVQGIASAPTKQQCGAGTLTIYTKVEEYLTWILYNINE